MHFEEALVELLIDLEQLDPNAEVYYYLTPGANPRIHFPTGWACFMPHPNGVPPVSETVRSTYAGLRTVLAKARICGCTGVSVMFEQLVPTIASHHQDVAVWVAQCRVRRSTWTRDWDCYAIVAAPAATGWNALDAAVAAEVDTATAHLRQDRAGPEFAQWLTTDLRVGEQRLHDAGLEACISKLVDEVPEGMLPSAPRPNTDSGLIAHHDQYRAWIVLTMTDLANGFRVLSHVDPFEGQHQSLRLGDVLVTLPVAVIAAATIGNRVIGLDAGYDVRDVAQTIDVFPDSVPLADRLAALAATYV